MLLEKFQLPSFSLFEKIQKGVDSVKAAKALKEKGELSDEIILMTDKMYLKMGTQFHGGNYVGADESCIKVFWYL